MRGEGGGESAEYLFTAFLYSVIISSKFILTDISNPFPVRVYVFFRNRNTDEATLNDAKKALSDNGIVFDTLKSWNSSRCENYP
jgi:hypothetical protein